MSEISVVMHINGAVCLSSLLFAEEISKVVKTSWVMSRAIIAHNAGAVEDNKKNVSYDLENRE